jgi:hypothetical protein
MSVQCGRILCEFKIVSHTNINKVSHYAQNLKQCESKNEIYCLFIYIVLKKVCLNAKIRYNGCRLL